MPIEVTPALAISEMFYSLQGEGKDTGLPTYFIRVEGCNLAMAYGGCTYCDTRYAQLIEGSNPMTFEAIVEVVKQVQPGRICVTGGEPLYHGETMCQFLNFLVENVNAWVTVETNGSYLIPRPKEKTGYQTSVSPSVSWNVDIKCPSSGMHAYCLYENLKLLQIGDQAKFVIGDHGDYEYAKTVLKSYPTRGHVVFQPSFGALEPAVLADWMLKDKYPARLSLQLHKILFGPTKRGV